MMSSKGSIRLSSIFPSMFFISSSFFSFTFTFIFLHSTFLRPVSLFFSTAFSFYFLYSATVLLDAKGVVYFKIKGGVPVILWMSEQRGFGKGIQPGIPVHGASSHHFLCPSLDPSASDISGFPTTAFQGIEAKAGEFFFLCCLEARIC